jgi:hypothetical protein
MRGYTRDYFRIKFRKNSNLRLKLRADLGHHRSFALTASQRTGRITPRDDQASRHSGDRPDDFINGFSANDQTDTTDTKSKSHER